MDTDLNYFLGYNSTDTAISFNFTNNTGIYDGSVVLPSSGIPVTGLDIVITFMIIQTIVLFVSLWYQMRSYQHWSGGNK